MVEKPERKAEAEGVPVTGTSPFPPAGNSSTEADSQPEAARSREAVEELGWIDPGNRSE